MISIVPVHWQVHLPSSHHVGPAGRLAEATTTVSLGSRVAEYALLTTQLVKLAFALAGPLTSTLRDGPAVTCTVALDAASPLFAPSLCFQQKISTPWSAATLFGEAPAGAAEAGAAAASAAEVAAGAAGAVVPVGVEEPCPKLGVAARPRGPEEAAAAAGVPEPAAGGAATGELAAAPLPPEEDCESPPVDTTSTAAKAPTPSAQVMPIPTNRPVREPFGAGAAADGAPQLPCETAGLAVPHPLPGGGYPAAAPPEPDIAVFPGQAGCPGAAPGVP